MTISRDFSKLAPGADSSGVLQPSRGGTGLTSPGTAGNALVSTGTGWTSAPVSAGGSGGGTSSGDTVLTSSSGGAQAITTTDWGQSVTLPDATTMSKGACVFNIENTGGYPLRVRGNTGKVLGFLNPGKSCVIGLADNSTAAGVWQLSDFELAAITAAYFSTAIYNKIGSPRSVVLDASRILFTGGSASTDIVAIVYDISTNTWGTPVVVRAAGGNHISYGISANEVLVCSAPSSAATAFQAVVLTVTGTSISVGTAASLTLSNNWSTFYNFATVGSTYVLCMSLSTVGARLLAMTVSGGAVTLGSVTTTAGTSASNTAYVYANSTSEAVCVSMSSTAIFAQLYNVSGVTLTDSGASPSQTTTGTNFRITPVSGGARYLILYQTASTTTLQACLINVSAGVITMSAGVNVISTTAQAASASVDLGVNGSKVTVVSGMTCNTVTDTGGSLTAGTAISVFSAQTGGTVAFIRLAGDVMTFVVLTGPVIQLQIDTSGASPVQLSTSHLVFPTSSAVNGTNSVTPYNQTKPVPWLIGDEIAQSIGAASTTSAVGLSIVLSSKTPYSRYSQAAVPAATFTSTSAIMSGTTTYGHYDRERYAFIANTGNLYASIFRFEGIS